MYEFQEYPKHVYRGEESRIVNTKEEETALVDAGWTALASAPAPAAMLAEPGVAREYVEFPKFKHSPAGESQIVHDPDQEQALGDGWYDHPSQFPGAEPAAPSEAAPPSGRKPKK